MHFEPLPNWPLLQILLLILWRNSSRAASTTVLYFILTSQSVQSVTDLNRMFHNALLMICWFGAIPLSCMSSPQVSSCDSLMKRLWWKHWDNIIFGGLPYGALRLVHDPGGETWPSLWFAAVLRGARANSSLSAVWGTWHFLASLLDIILCLQMNITACWLSVRAAFQLGVTARWKGRESENVCEHGPEKFTEHHHIMVQTETYSKSAPPPPQKKGLQTWSLKGWLLRPISMILMWPEPKPPQFHQIRAVVSKISQFPQFQGQG